MPGYSEARERASVSIVTCCPNSALKKSLSGDGIWLQADGKCRDLIRGHDYQQHDEGAIGGREDAKRDGNPRERAARGSRAGQQAHDQPQVVPGDVDQVSLVEVLATAQPGP